MEPAPGTAYDVLGLSAECTDDEIHRAYRALAKVTHPDAGGDPVMFDVLNEAYEQLETPAKRADYDRGLRPPAAQAPPRQQPPPRSAGGDAVSAPGCLGWFVADLLIGPRTIAVILGLPVVLLWILWTSSPLAGALVSVAVAAVLVVALFGVRRRRGRG